MKFTIDWLKEHLETNATFEEIIDKLEQLGLPCERTCKAHSSWNEIEVIKIIEKASHPNADRLNLYKIELANGEVKQVVCGDQTLDVGVYAPYARDGITIACGLTLKLAKIRGIESPGMLCSIQDLGIPSELVAFTKNGVLKLEAEYFGKTISQALESCGLIEIELTPNRGDVMSVRGIARALSEHGLGTLLPLQIVENVYSANHTLGTINSSNCQALALAEIEHQARQTSAKISNRLKLVGQSPTGIDAIDITNYVAHEIGQPMHAFDMNKLNGPISITNLTKEEKYFALSLQEMNLSKNTLVIKDNREIVSWPGVIGGENSKIELSSNKILLETGIFKIDSIQRRKNGIQTLAAKRFEYGVDTNNLQNAIDRFCYLIGAKTTKAEYHPFKEKSVIQFDLSYIKKILGIEITIDQLKAKLEPRGFIINDDLTIQVPSNKYFDIKTPNCIVEEFAMGEYEKIEALPLPAKKINRNQEKDSVLIKSLENSAIECGFNQTYHFTLTSEENAKSTLAEKAIPQGIKIMNASNLNYSCLRTSLIPQLLNTANWHEQNAHPEREFFEIGLIYGNYENYQKLSFTAISIDQAKLLKILYHFLESNKFQNLESETHSAIWQDSGLQFSSNKKIIAHCGRIKQNLKNKKSNIYYALEIEVENLSHIPKKQLAKPSLHAPVYKDISFKLPAQMQIHELTNLLTKNNIKFNIFDVYPNTNINQERNCGIRIELEYNENIEKIELNNQIEKIKSLVEKELKIIS